MSWLLYVAMGCATMACAGYLYGALADHEGDEQGRRDAAWLFAACVAIWPFMVAFLFALLVVSVAAMALAMLMDFACAAHGEQRDALGRRL